jgi:hypothetical protein
MLAIKNGYLKHFLRPGLPANDLDPGFDDPQTRKGLEGIGIIPI